MSLFREPEFNVYVDTELTEQETALRQRIQTLRQQAEETKSALQAAEGECKHEVFYDVDAGIYAYRFCAICDRITERI